MKIREASVTEESSIEHSEDGTGLYANLFALAEVSA